MEALSGSLPMLLMIVALFAVMYFLMIRPQRKQEKAMAEMKNNLEVGDEITTIGGIIGEVISIKGETVVIESGHNKTRIRILRDAIKSVDVKANGEVPSLDNKKKDDKKEEKKDDAKEDKTEEKAESADNK